VDRFQNELYLGFVFSLVGHSLLLVLLLGAVGPRLKDLGKPIVYSVSIEGGSKLGGISQLPKTDKAQPVAPPKNIAEAEKQAEKAAQPEKAEVSLAEERTKAEEEKKRKEEEERKKREAALKEAQAKATPKATPKPSLADINKRLEAAVQRYTGESTDAGGEGFGAGALGGKGMGGGLLRPPAFFVYRDTLKNHIKSGWRWYDTSAALITVVEFEILPDGNLDNIRILERSGNLEYDDSVYRAVLKSSPVPVPPAEIYEAFFRKVTMRFDPRE